MDEAPRKVLKQYKGELNKNLILEDSILEKLEQDDVLKEKHVNKIKVKKTNEDKISELLFILPRRGPRAFKAFMEATRTDYKHVAEMLEIALNEELDKVNARHQLPPKRSASSSDVSMRSLSNRSSPDIGKNELTQTDDMEFTISSLCSNNASDITYVLVQRNLNSIYLKLKTHLTSSSMRELSLNSPQPVNFQMVHDLVDDILRLEKDCYSILGMKDRSLSLLSLIKNIIDKNEKLESELKSKEEQRNKYAHNIMKLEHMCRDYSSEIKNLKKEKTKLKTMVKDLKAEAKQLEEALKIMEDKEKEIKETLGNVSEELVATKSELDALTKKYECVVGNFNGSNRLAAQKSMVVSGKSPEWESRRRGEPIPNNASRLEEHKETVAELYLTKGENNNEQEQNISQSKKQSVEVGKRRHSTTLYPDFQRARGTKSRTPLGTFEITSGVTTRPCFPVAAPVVLSPRSPKHQRNAKRTNFTQRQ